jgi:superfamily II DNA or RNA helicase
MTREDIQNEALKVSEKKKRCGLGLATGVGKTLVGLRHMQQHYTPLKNILVVAPKTSIFSSWTHDAVKFNLDYMLSNVTFTTYLSLTKHDPREYDVVYLDECHSLLDSHRDFLENFDGIVLGLTGTPPKYRNSEKGKMVDEFCPIEYTFVTDAAIENNILNDYQIVVHQIKLDTRKNFPIKSNSGTFLSSEQLNYNYWSHRIETTKSNSHIVRVMRMKALQEYRSKEEYTKILLKSISSKCIVFANTQEQADRLCSHSYHSTNPNSAENLDLFKNGEILQLSCVAQLNEGVNIPNLKQGIIMHAYGNERKAAQRIGRLLRLNPDDKAIVHILCYMDSIDEKWVKEALENFDDSKIIWKDYGVKLP